MSTRVLSLSIFTAAALALSSGLAAEATGAAAEDRGVFSRDNLVAWCVVPFDAKGRGPEERAQMLERLGIRKLAYDWRDKDIPTFDDEVRALGRHGIELTAFWCPSGTLDPASERHVGIILDLIRRHGLRTQLWFLLNDGLLSGLEPEKRVEAAANALRPLAAKAAELGCAVGLYNHGGWFGEPENQIAIIEKLGARNVGIVYNLHHGHEHVDRFGELFEKMRPHLLAVNLNGMKKGGPKILPVGSGDEELALLRVIRDSGYGGLIGILDHRAELDAELSLTENLQGLDRVLGELGQDGWVSLFNGRDLEGWAQRNGWATYRIEDRAIVGKTSEGSPNSFLCTRRDYGDFELVFEVKVDDPLNSGVQIRSRSTKEFEGGRVHGPQVEIEAAPGESGYIYSEGTGRGWLSQNRSRHDTFHNGAWNAYRVRAVGPGIQTWVNGEPVADLADEESPREGFVGLQVHGIGGGTGPFEVRWRNIRIREIR